MVIKLNIPSLEALKGMMAQQAGISPAMLAQVQAEKQRHSYKYITKRCKSQPKRRKLERHTR